MIFSETEMPINLISRHNRSGAIRAALFLTDNFKIYIIFFLKIFCVAAFVTDNGRVLGRCGADRIITVVQIIFYYITLNFIALPFAQDQLAEGGVIRPCNNTAACKTFIGVQTDADYFYIFFLQIHA